MEVPELLRAESAALYARAHRRLDSVIAGLETDLMDRDETTDPLAWLMSQRWLADNVTPAYMTDLLTTALYRLARQNMTTK